jgi:hypothetical protein
MSVFSRIKNKFLGRKESDYDYQDLRSSVLNEPPKPEGYEPYEPPTPEPPEPRFLRQREPEYDERFRTPSQKRYEELSLEPYGQTPPGQQQEMRYDIIERLNIIEAQLSAIRSQTETINERLKNLEMRLTGRRY